MTKETGGCPQTPQRTEELYEEVRFQDQPALFTSLRVKAASIPEGLHRYEIRHEGGEPCQITRGILVDHYGTLLTRRTDTSLFRRRIWSFPAGYRSRQRISGSDTRPQAGM